jgi:hypothetical protein
VAVVCAWIPQPGKNAAALRDGCCGTLELVSPDGGCDPADVEAVRPPAGTVVDEVLTEPALGVNVRLTLAAVVRFGFASSRYVSNCLLLTPPL